MIRYGSVFHLHTLFLSFLLFRPFFSLSRHWLWCETLSPLSSQFVRNKIRREGIIVISLPRVTSQQQLLFLHLRRRRCVSRPSLSSSTAEVGKPKTSRMNELQRAS
ncbi:hypothetical protein AAZV13_18G041500 [Glycine max]